MKRIRFSITYPERLVHPLHRNVMGEIPITRAELLIWSPTEDATTLCWCDGNREATERAVTGIDSLVESSYVADVDGTYAFLRQDDYEFSAPLLDTIADSEVVFLPPVVFLETGDVEFVAVGETEALSTFHEELSKLGELTIEQVHDFERRHAASRPTERQWSALEAAVSIGYYEIPRTGSIADVAARLDCSASTAGELVRKAEAAVIKNRTETRGRG